jgi:hypothetical protein
MTNDTNPHHHDSCIPLGADDLRYRFGPHSLRVAKASLMSAFDLICYILGTSGSTAFWLWYICWEVEQRTKEANPPGVTP